MAKLKNYKIFFFALIALFIATSPAYPQNQITKISTTTIGNQTQLKFEIDKIPKYKIFTIKEPDRLVVDFTDSNTITTPGNFTHHLFFHLPDLKVNIADLFHLIFKGEILQIVLEYKISRALLNRDIQISDRLVISSKVIMAEAVVFVYKHFVVGDIPDVIKIRNSLLSSLLGIFTLLNCINLLNLIKYTFQIINHQIFFTLT